MKIFNTLLVNALLTLITLYRYAISPLLPARCRYYPTCSCYAIEALRLHGGVYGSLLTIKRLLRCHPWGGSGVDFVPLPLYRYTYRYVTPLININPLIPYQHRFY